MVDYAEVIEKEPLFRALADIGLRLGELDVDALLPRLIDFVPDSHLPLLAESMSVMGFDGWYLAENDDARRTLITHAYELHRYKGTSYAIRQLFYRLGFGEVGIDEGLTARSYQLNYAIPDNEKWAHYAVRLSTPVTNEQASRIRQMLDAFAPARCVLAVLDYKAAPIRYNNKAKYDGSYNHGSA